MEAAPHPSITTRTGAAVSDPRAPARRMHRDVASMILTRGIVLIAIACTAASMWTRVEIARNTAWQCDELPLLMRFTSLGLWATTEAEARANFTPGGYSLREGLIRSVSVPKGISAYHSTTGVWTNLTISAMGYSRLVGRLMPLVWSLVAVLAAATAAMLIGRTLLAGSFAAIIVALSPFATAHAAQVRGYAEAMAAAVALLLALEWWRRSPYSAVRICAVFLLGLQASLTVYTVWVYWVLPIFLCALITLPSNFEAREKRRAARAMIAVTFAALVATMSLFTLQRLPSLTFSSTFGRRFDSITGAAGFVMDSATTLLPLAPVTLLAAAAGAVTLYRTPMRWWIWAGLSAIAILIVFAMQNGSLGYARNLSYLIGPVAALAGVGLASVAHQGMHRAPKRAAPILAALTLLVTGGAAAAGAASLRDRAYAQLLPDWGAVATTIKASEKAARPRHLALCKANHWQIRWELGDAANPPSAEPPRPFDLIVGAQRDESGRRVIFRSLRGSDGIRPAPLPEWLRRIPVQSEIAGVELRAFSAEPVELDSVPADRPLFVAVRSVSGTPAQAWQRFVDSPVIRDAGLIPLKEIWEKDAFVQTLIVGRNGPETVETLVGGLDETPLQVTAYVLGPPRE